MTMLPVQKNGALLQVTSPGYVKTLFLQVTELFNRWRLDRGDHCNYGKRRYETHL